MSVADNPSQPEGRTARHLPRKSYAEAAEPQSNGLVEAGSLGAPQTNGFHDITPGEYTGSGILDVPSQSPVRGHRRVGSKASRDVLRANGNGNSVKKPDSPRSGGVDKENGEAGDNGTVVEEKYHDPKGEHLTSIKPSDDYKDERRQDQIDKIEKRNDTIKLVSGRRAGAGWERSGIHWAPLNVPVKRRLQTCMVLLHTLSIALFLTTFFFLCAVPLLWPLLVPYLLYILFSNAHSSGELSHRSEALRRLPIWSLFASYFPARLHRSQTLEPTRKYIFGYHPHGIISHGAFAAFSTEALGFGQLFPGITNTLLTLDSNFRIPLYRDYALRLGLGSVSRESCENLLSKGGTNGEGMGRAITIVVGGARESLDASPGNLRLVLGRRKGFVKLAIRNGADLVPVLAFGENDLYDQVDSKEHPLVHKVQMWVKRFMGFTVPLFHARGVFNYDVGLLPYRRSLNIVVGRPIRVQTESEPGQEVIDRVHREYVDELQRLWDDWKDTFARERNAELEIVE